MAGFADLEISLHRRDADSYTVELRYSSLKSDADIWRVQDRSKPLRFDFEQLRAHALEYDVAAYGKLLTQHLFADESIKLAFAQARSATQAQAALRFRLFIDPTAPELHGLRWETLQDPQTGDLLFTGEHLLFSRYLSSQDWREARLRPRMSLKALVVIANPAHLDRYQLAPIDVDGEFARAQAGLGDIQITPLKSLGSANVNNVFDHLREGDGYDILYLVCHGTLSKGEPWLWLEEPDGNVARLSGDDLATRMNELQQPPRLVVLASCQSAGAGNEARDGDRGALAAAGPRLAEAGVPAVLAMQGNITVQTVAEFMPVFFRELQRDGQIDRAVAIARGAVRHRPDWWMPVLYMRLKSGSIWYVPGFADEREGFQKWPALVSNIRDRKCTLILGPGLPEYLLGSRRQIARHWSETYSYPLAPHDREDLARVAQFLAFNQQRGFPRRKLGEYMRQEIQRRYASDLPEELRAEQAPLDQLINAVGAKRRSSDPHEPHKVLAQLPFPIFITSNPDNLLYEALVECGKKPRVELCRWNHHLERLPSTLDRDYRPDPDNPLVYHLFGRIDTPLSLVLTEDDYFKYLVGVTHNRELIPSALRLALADSALLFLGFQMDDWHFRVVFHSLMQEEGSDLLREYAHIAVQVDPEDTRMLHTDRARNYLESYLGGAHDSAHIGIFWGSVEDFIKKLHEHTQVGQS